MVVKWLHFEMALQYCSWKKKMRENRRKIEDKLYSYFCIQGQENDRLETGQNRLKIKATLFKATEIEHITLRVIENIFVQRKIIWELSDVLSVESYFSVGRRWVFPPSLWLFDTIYLWDRNKPYLHSQLEPGFRKSKWLDHDSKAAQQSWEQIPYLHPRLALSLNLQKSIFPTVLDTSYYLSSYCPSCYSGRAQAFPLAECCSLEGWSQFASFSGTVGICQPAYQAGICIVLNNALHLLA